jgi:hypothetical protein
MRHLMCYLRYPHIDGDLITFAAEDDVWLASLSEAAGDVSDYPSWCPWWPAWLSGSSTPAGSTVSASPASSSWGI